MTVSRKTCLVAACAALLPLLVSGAPAGAVEETAAKKAPAPVTSETLSEGNTAVPFVIKADDTRRFLSRKITVRPGGTGGWHTHAGEQVAIIHSGVLTRYDSECRPHVYKAGDAVVEPADPADVHIGINEGTEPLVLYVVDMLPAGSPVAVPASDPGCGLPK